MKKMVVALCARSGGALTDLLEIYSDATKDNSNEWFFLLGDSNLESKDNIKIFKHPKMQIGWIKRIVFGAFHCTHYINNIRPDEIFYLDYIIKKIKSYNPKTYIYSTNALFYTDIHFSLLKSPNLWLRQNLLKFFEYRSVNTADIIIVETDWMKEEISKKLQISEEKIVVKQHTVTVGEGRYIPAEDFTTFFYPAAEYIYKNHSLVVEAISRMAEKNFEVVFTLNGDENKTISKLKQRCEENNLPVKWIGRVDRQEVFDYLKKSVLLFPSYLETIGLPLLEAKEFETPIICSDLKYARSALGDYENVAYIDYNDPDSLKKEMEKYI